MDHLLPWLRLQFTAGLGRAGLMRLIDHYRNPQKALDDAADGWSKLPGLNKGLVRNIPPAEAGIVQDALERLVRHNAWMLSFWDPAFPTLLRQLPDPPAILYGRGRWPEGPALAIVGARLATEFGRRFTEGLAAELAAAGLVIVSGLARGIDAAAHRGALAGGGQTIAVLGCGVDRVYPAENDRLYHQIIEQGAVLSEYPPGSEPLPGHFPGRNRIISGLSQGTLVVEAGRNSGSLITAEFALEQGREVMAVPGAINQKTSYGPNLLIKQGAHPVTEPIDILDIYGVAQDRVRAAAAGPPEELQLSDPARRVLGFLDLTPRHCDQLAGESGLTPMELSAILLHLELRGYAEKLPGGCYILGRRAHPA